MSAKNPSGFLRYLEAKKSVDDRALNARVWSRLLDRLTALPRTEPRRILELGGGIGTMVERLRDAGALSGTSYTLLDLDPRCLDVARSRLLGRSPGTLPQASGPGQAGLHLQVGDAIDFLDHQAGQGWRWDVVIAHAFLDLVDLQGILPAIRDGLVDGGLLYGTINFDGLTVLEPPLDPKFESRLLACYHRTMDERRFHGRPAGHSQTGRRLLTRVKNLGGQILEAGSSDWVIWAGPGGYPDDEGFFLQYLVDMITSAVAGCSELPADALTRWREGRRAQIERGELILIAHQLDLLCQFGEAP